MNDTAQPTNCPKCGAPIPAEAPGGLCPKCVLLGAATGTEAGLPGATATSEIPSLERVAAAFPQLEILELIGRGGMGFVFKGRQPHLDRFVALKLLPDRLARDPRFAERFNREGRVLARLNHPNIVCVYDFGKTEHFYFLLMEFVDGVNLRQAMQAGRFSPAEALGIVPKICEALQYAHEQGILHRDIKPENILLDTRGHVKIADFGIAKLVGEDQPDVALTATGAALGTAHYMAPEQLEKPSEVDHRADIYSLGVVFYEMLTGELPIGRFAPPSSKTPVGANVDEVVFRALEKDRERRYQSAGEVKTQVEHLTTEAGTAAPEATPSPAGVGPHGTAIVGDPTAVRRPAKALVAAGIFNWIGSAAVIALLGFTGWTRNLSLSPWELGVAAGLIIVLSSLIILGALKMARLQAYPLALLAGGLAMITSPGSLIGLPIGLWALVVLRRPEVRAAFNARRAASGHREAARYSQWAFWGAMMVGLSLAAPFSLVAAALAGAGGLAPAEFWLALGGAAIPGLGGTLLGWLGLNEIRDSGRRLRGLPLALFATLAWPLTLLCGGAVGLPALLTFKGDGASAPGMLGRVLVLLLPAGAITFAFWAVHATGRWASQQPVTRQRGLLKWVFIVLLVAGIGVVLVTQPGQRPVSRPQPEPNRHSIASEPAVATLPSPVRANFRIARGQVVTFEVLRRDQDTPVPVASFVGYAVAPDEERARCSLLLEPVAPFPWQTNRPAWRFTLVTEDGATVAGGIQDLGELIPQGSPKDLLTIEPDSSLEIMLTRPYPGAETNGLTPRPHLTVAIVSRARGGVGGPQAATTVSAGSTNWTQLLKQPAAAKRTSRPQPGEVLASQWLKSPAGTNTTNTILFTFTSVELRREAGHQWLAMDYATDVRGDCEIVFRVDGREIMTRKSGLLATPAGSPPVLRERFEVRLPAGVNQTVLEDLRNEFAKALVGKSFLVPEGEQRPLLRLPIGTAGDISVAIGAKRRVPTPPPSEQPEQEFGPDVEVTLPDLLTEGDPFAFGHELSVGLTSSVTERGRTYLLQWLAGHGTDLAVIDYHDDNWGLAMRPTTRRLERRWHAVDLQSVKEALAGAEVGLETLEAPSAGLSLYRLPPDAVPLAFAVRTSRGGLAALQILGFSENPRGVKLRYKLARAEAP